MPTLVLELPVKIPQVNLWVEGIGRTSMYPQASWQTQGGRVGKMERKRHPTVEPIRQIKIKQLCVSVFFIYGSNILWEGTGCEVCSQSLGRIE